MADPCTVTIDVGRALQQTIALALRRRYPAKASVSALRAFSTLGEGGTSSFEEPNVELVPVGAVIYSWSATSTAADDGSAVIRPADRGSLPGRWLKTTSTSTSGYLAVVRIYEGEDGEEPSLVKLSGQTPWVQVIFRGETPDKQSQIPGAFYRLMMEFEIRAGSRSLRGGNEALLGSAISDEASADPGVERIIGDVRQAIVWGDDLGLPEIVDFCYPGAHGKVLEDAGERYFVHKLMVRVPATVRFEDADGEDVALSELALQFSQVAPDGTTTNDVNPDDPDIVPAA